MKKFALGLLLILAATASEAQFTRYIIRFRNKATSPFSLGTPLPYLSQRAIDRRTRYGIAVDSTDLPITPRYIDSVRLAGSVTILNVSRWLNQISIQTSDAAALAKINSFPFVLSAQPIAARLVTASGAPSPEWKRRHCWVYQPSPYQSAQQIFHGDKAVSRKRQTRNPKPKTGHRVQNTTADFFSYGSAYEQVHIHNGEFLHNIGLRGQNMVIGILDGGFRNYTTLRAFDSVNQNGQVLGTWDFVARESSVIEDDPHGMQCFSVIAGNVPGQLVGSAPKASFHLFRSEDAGTEYPIEEHNWVCAAERLDSAGGDLLSSSLGYSDGMSNPVFDHTYAEMNGNTTIAARGADLAAKKGILVANSAGNDGAGSFHFIATPADGDSVMAVGAVTKAGVVAGFSSYGPSSDLQVKPDVASVGVSTALWTTGNVLGASNGTSFSCPNMLGLATCLWQGFPEVNNMRILNALRQAGSKATAPDDRVGYGIPDVKKAVIALLKEFSTANVTASACRNTINWTSKDVSTMKYELERRAPGEATFTKVGERQGTGALFGTRSYQYADSLINVQAGTISYRIRQIIDTAAATLTADYTDTVTVSLGASCITTAINPVLPAGEEIVLMPNPAREKFTLKMTTPYPVQTVVVRIVNAKGQVVATHRKSKGTGTATFDFPAYGFAVGKYFVSIYNNERLMVTKELLKL